MPLWTAELTPYRLPLRHPWRSHAGSWMERRGWLLRLTDHRGFHGYGDAAPLPEMGSEPPERCEAWLHQQVDALQSRSPASALSELPEHGDHPAARCALECALLDLQARQQQQPLWQRLGAEKQQPIRLNAAIGDLDQGVTERALNAVSAGFDILKLKLATHPEAQELDLLQQLAATLPNGIRLRLDANRAWTPHQAEHWIDRLNQLPVESLEEPLATWDNAILRDLQDSARFDLAADESLPGFLQHHTLSALPVRRLVIKPMLLGGLLPARNLIRQAAGLGLRCVITSSLESSAGLWPLCHLATLADQVAGPAAHGLATGAIFSHDLGPSPAIEQGRITPGNRPGSGFEAQLLDLNHNRE